MFQRDVHSTLLKSYGVVMSRNVGLFRGEYLELWICPARDLLARHDRLVKRETEM